MAIQTALVVDDSRSARYILQRLLERQHISVEGVGSAREALSYLREYLPDVVFMDDMMPGMEGQEAINRLALNPATAKIPIVMYTARDYSAEEIPPQGGGVVGVLSKPFTPQDVDELLLKLGGTLKPPPVTAKLIRQPAPVASKLEQDAVSESIERVTPRQEEPAAMSQLVAAELKKAALAALVAHESRIVPTLHSVVDNAAPGVAQKIDTQMHAAHLSRRVAEAVDLKRAELVEHIDDAAQQPVNDAGQFKQKQFEAEHSRSLDTKLTALQSGPGRPNEGETQRALIEALQHKQKQIEENMSLTLDARLSALQMRLVERVDSQAQRVVGDALQLKQKKLEEHMSSALEEKLSALQVRLVERVDGEAQRVVNNALHHKQQLEESMSLSIEARLSTLQARIVEHVDGEAQRAVGDALQRRQQQLEDNISMSVESRLSALQVLLVERVESETRRAVGAALKINQGHLENCIAEAVDSRLADIKSQLVELKNDMRRAVEQMIGELFANGVRPHIQQMEECMRQAMSDLRYELSCSQEQVLEQRIPQLLDAVEQRQRQRVDALHGALVKSMENTAEALCNLSS